MEFITGFFAGSILWPIALVAFVLLGILAEHGEARGWAVFFAIGAFVAIYVLQPGIAPGTLAVYAVIYLGIGIVWSVYRYWRWVRSQVAYINSRAYDHTDYGIQSKKSAIERLHFSKKLDTMAAWVIVWPFSMLENVAGDLIDTIKSLFGNVFKQLLQAIYNAATKDLIK